MPRVKTLLHEVVVTAFQRSLSADQFIADAISEKLARTVTCVWTGPDGSEFARVDFTSEIFASIKHVASKMGITLQQFFENAIREKVGREPVASSRRCASIACRKTEAA